MEGKPSGVGDHYPNNVWIVVNDVDTVLGGAHVKFDHVSTTGDRGLRCRDRIFWRRFSAMALGVAPMGNDEGGGHDNNEGARILGWDKGTPAKWCGCHLGKVSMSRIW